MTCCKEQPWQCSNPHCQGTGECCAEEDKEYAAAQRELLNMSPQERAGWVRARDEEVD